MSLMIRYSIRGENIEVTEALRDYVENKLSKIEKYFNEDQELNARVNLKIYRGKIARKHREKVSTGEVFSVDFNKEEVEEAPSVEVVRTKNIELKPMDVEEAILQMELLSHDFFIYADSEDHTINVLYKREDGNYGLIEAK